MRIRLLRQLLLLDAAVLLLLGLVFVFAPAKVLEAFGFTGLPAAVNYIVALWGCVLFTLGFGYFIAASDPVRHVAWVQVGIARGALECVAGVIYCASGVVSWQQAAFGLVAATFITLGYIVLYPKRTIAHAAPA